MKIKNIIVSELDINATDEQKDICENQQPGTIQLRLDLTGARNSLIEKEITRWAKPHANIMESALPGNVGLQAIQAGTYSGSLLTHTYNLTKEEVREDLIKGGTDPDLIDKDFAQQQKLMKTLNTDDISVALTASLLGAITQAGAIEMQEAKQVMAETFNEIGGHAAEQMIRKAQTLLPKEVGAPGT